MRRGAGEVEDGAPGGLGVLEGAGCSDRAERRVGVDQSGLEEG